MAAAVRGVASLSAAPPADVGVLLLSAPARLTDDGLLSVLRSALFAIALCMMAAWAIAAASGFAGPAGNAYCDLPVNLFR